MDLLTVPKYWWNQPSCSQVTKTWGHSIPLRQSLHTLLMECPYQFKKIVSAPPKIYGCLFAYKLYSINILYINYEHYKYTNKIFQGDVLVCLGSYNRPCAYKQQKFLPQGSGV